MNDEESLHTVIKLLEIAAKPNPPQIHTPVPFEKWDTFDNKILRYIAPDKKKKKVISRMVLA